MLVRGRGEQPTLHLGGPVPGRERTVRMMLALVATLLAAAAAAGSAATAQEPPDLPLEERPDVAEGRHLFQRDCAYCHGPRGRGTAQGPPIAESGTAAVHFMVSAGYMPLRQPEQPLRRNRPFYREEQIDALLSYVEGFVTGPSVPEVTVDPAVVAHGGALFRLHCASCHQFAGTGGVLVGSNEAPTLHHATPTQMVEALRIGPGDMPRFSEDIITPEEADAIATYVELAVRHPRDEGGIALGHFGPWSEGFVAWFGGLGTLMVVATWIGRRT